MERVEPSMVKGGVIVPSAKKRSPKARQSYQLILGAVTRGYHLPRAIPKVKVFDENLRAEIGAAAFASSSNILPSDFNILAHPSRHRKKIPILHQEQATCTKIFNNEPMYVIESSIFTNHNHPEETNLFASVSAKEIGAAVPSRKDWKKLGHLETQSSLTGPSTRHTV